MLHHIYRIIGHIYALFSNFFYSVRDYLFPPKEEAVLFVAHPDDDALFFHSFITNYKPYVVLLTTGAILKRVRPFCRAMNHYGVKYRTFDINSRAVDKEKSISKNVRKVLKRSHFSICATHNEEGEYGHEMHKCVHRCVVENWEGDTLFVPYFSEEIVNYPLDEYTLHEKQRVLFEFYEREYPVLETHKIWINHEAFRKIMRD